MKKGGLLYIDKLRKNISKLLAFIVIVYSVCITVLYQYYQGRVEIEKRRILQDYYDKIVKISANKIGSLATKLSSNVQNVSIDLGIAEIKICNVKCINHNLFRFGALIDQYMPEFIYYKIDLNNKFLYSNNKIPDYQIEKIHRLNAYNQFNISLAIDQLYWSKVEKKIKKPLRMIASFAIVNILFLYIFSKFLFKSFNKVYKLHYQNKYKEELEQLKLSYKEELKRCKDSLMNKIWNLNFNRQKDLEINCLFALEANQIALINDDHENTLKCSKLKNSGNKLPCSIILYQEDKIEEINTKELIDIFNDRFGQEDENISVQISSKTKKVYFASKASLYQIIYSLISYLIFMINKQSPIVKQNISLIINNTEKGMLLYFEYGGFPIMGEEELLRMSYCFFRTHANPFLLNINQVFNVLRVSGFDCNISYDQSNIINISRAEQKNSEQIIEENNVIFLSSFTKKRND
jgi:hypothetical protein